MTFSAVETPAVVTTDTDIDTAASYLLNTTVFIAPARFDVHTTDSLADQAERAIASDTHLVLDLRMVDFIDEHIIATIDEISSRAVDAGVSCTIAEMSPAAALTFDFLRRVVG